VIAVGAPVGEPDSFGYGTVLSTSGVKTVTDGEYSLFTTDISGSSNGSGILINLDGEVVGFIMQQFAQNDSGSITAVPISPLKSLIELLSNRKPLPYAGIEGQDVSQAVSKETDMPEGIYVTSVAADSPALTAGLMPGDIIVSVDESKTITLRLLHDRLMSKTPGDTMKIGIKRLGADGYVDFTFTLTAGEALMSPENTEEPAAESAPADKPTESKTES
jgi:S1-C subfamily serine protease